ASILNHLDRIERAQFDASTKDKAPLERQHEEVTDCWHHTHNAASFLIPCSPTGAAVQIMLAIGDVDQLGDEAGQPDAASRKYLRDEIEHRINRLLYAALQYLTTLAPAPELDPVR